VMMILVNVFALLSAALFFFKKVSPGAFLISSFLWIVLMLIFWFILPRMVYRRAQTFRDSFQASFSGTGFTIENDRGSRTWPWQELSNWMESPHFFHLYFNPRSFFIVPKEAFAGETVHEARKMLTAHISKK
jgi:YcxB-like protein